ncbi:MAG: adenine deaminase [Treponema sp.]|jgi:adenine deaminase|nr:adenine deaminase [Treponema sp.]
MNRESLKKVIDTAAGRIPADLVIRNGKIADVYTGRIVEADLAVTDGVIAGTGIYEGQEVIDAGGLYLLPGFIDSHIHIESSFLCPPELGRLLLPCGTAAIIADPHEIANVAGLAGITYMMEAAKGTPLDIKFMLPSCVPAAPWEQAGAELGAGELEKPLREKDIPGLGEMMAYPLVIAGEKSVLDKMFLAIEEGKLIDGHSPGVRGKDLNAYSAFIHTDHECSTVEEMEDRISRGMYVMLRQGSACKDLCGLIRGLTRQNSRRCLLCSDDLQPRSIFEEGHMDNNLRICVREGVDPLIALRMATLNAAECFRLYDRGGLAPGCRADITMVDNLRDFNVRRVLIKGKIAAEDGKCTAPVFRTSGESVRGSFHVRDFSAKKLVLKLSSDTVRVIDIKGGSVVTGSGTTRVRRGEDGSFIHDPESDIARIAVVERHRDTGNVGLGLIRGYGIRRGALAISVAHDSHNIITAGRDAADMAAAVERVISMGGGAVAVKNGIVLEEMPLPLGGIMSDQGGEWVDGKIRSLHQKAVEELGVGKNVEPLMTLCFMSLTAIPELKITDRGLFDTSVMDFVPIERQE